MSDLRSAYMALSPSSPRNEVVDVLQAIVDGSPLHLAAQTELCQAILDDLKSCFQHSGTPSRLSPSDAGRALLAVKTIGRNPAGSEVIATAANLSSLLAFAKCLGNDPIASGEALKCVANALLLIERARVLWVQRDVGGGHACIAMLENSTSPEEILVISRILHLCTASASSAGSFIRELVEGDVLDAIGTKVDLLMVDIARNTKMSNEAMTETLMFTFNLLVHYPKMIGYQELDEPAKRNSSDETDVADCWSHRLHPVLSSLLRVFASLPFTSSRRLQAPLTHVIHNLIMIPVSPRLLPLWTASPPPTLPELNISAPDHSPPPTHDALSKAFQLLDSCLEHYIPGDLDPDDASVQDACRKDGEASLDDLLSPLAILLTRLCTGDECCRRRMRSWVVPPDLDRTSPLESRPSFLGRSLRLLASVYHPRLKDIIGSMLFAMCDSDALSLSAQVGYGNVAGFLFHKGLLTGPPSAVARPSLTTPSGEVINPITGTVQGASPDLDMTDEEKEREAEKLFVLFERLERSGALPPDQNPIKQAAQNGRLQE